MDTNSNYDVLRLPQVIARTGMSRSAIYAALQNDLGFPQPIKLGARSIGFLSVEVDAFIRSRAELRTRKSS